MPWNESAERISAFVRGLDFGAADNPMGIPKLVVPAGVFLTPRVAILGTRSGAPPGTILRAGADGLEIATATSDLRIAQLTALDGVAIVPEAALDRLAAALGERLPATAPDPEHLVARERQCQRYEAEWISRLVEVAPLLPPGFEAAGAGSPTTDATIELDLPASAPADTETLIAAILVAVGGEIGQPFDVAFGEPELRAEIAAHGWQGFLAARLPIRVAFRESIELDEVARDLTEQRTRQRVRGTFATDLPLRSRRLVAAAAGSGLPCGPAVAIDLLAAGEMPPGLPAEGAIRLAIAVDPGLRKLTLRSRIAPESDPLSDFARRLAARLRESGDGRPTRRTLLPAGRPTTVSERFRTHAEERPDAPAVEWGDERWSYRQLQERASRLAAALARRGVGPGRLVALRLPLLPDLVTAMLAVHEAGGAFLVLDALDSPDRVARILAENRPLLAVGDSALHRPAPWLPLLPHLPIHPIGLADGCEHSPVRSGADPRQSTRPWDLAYVATTSGSTGAPKGVAVEHHALAHYIAAAGREFGISPTDRILQLASPAFDLALEQIFGALCHGATLVAFEEPSLPAPRELLARCGELGVSILDLPTAVWEQAATEIETHHLELPPSLRLLVLGGELASERAARVWLEATGGKHLINTYGPTEATIVATWWHAPPRASDLAERDGLPIGHPVEGVRAVVLDTERRPVAPGRSGELWLGGSGLARGYHLRPDLTAARFARFDPDGSTVAGAGDEPRRGTERFYATGDRVRWRGDGELKFLDRLDRQVKIAGRRVEPAEVEATLCTIAGVSAAAVAPAPAPLGGLRLRGWVVLAAEAELAAVKCECERRLPAFLRPSPLVAITALPLTLAGKVDYDRLLRESTAAPPEQAPTAGGEKSAESESEALERRLARLWGVVLGRGASSPIPRDADFFALGADSLAAVSLLIEIEAAFGVPLRVAELLRSPTLAGVAAALRSRMATEPGRGVASSLVTIVRPFPPAALADSAIFCVHGLGGHLLRLAALARALAPGRLLIGLQSPGLDDHRPIPQTVAELARTFLAEIRAQSILPPYRFAGMSFGGFVAYEMARLARPDEVQWVAMFDTELAEVLPGFRPQPLPVRARIRERLRRLGGDLLGRLRRLHRRLGEERDEALKANEYRHFSRVQRANQAALINYQPGAWPGRVTLLAATARPASVYEEFRRATGCKLEIVSVPGNHLSMLEPPNVDVLSAAITNLG